MLSKKQLGDLAKCGEIPCYKCGNCPGEKESTLKCTREAAKTALLYYEILERHVWHKRSSDDKLFCIECRNLKENRHTSSCELAEMLKEG